MVLILVEKPSVSHAFPFGDMIFRTVLTIHCNTIYTGQNGTIDGQGEVWWNLWRSRTLKYTRPNLIEFKNSKEIIISNVIFQNSPFWNIHPVYCRYM